MTITKLDLVKTQESLEAESRALGAARYRNQRQAPWVDALGPQVDEASMHPGRAMLRRALKPTAEAIRDFLDAGNSGRAGRRHAAYDLLKEAAAEPEPLAYLTLRCAIQAGIQQHLAQKAATMVARAVVDHLTATAFAKSNPSGSAGLQRKLSGRSLISEKRQRATAAVYDAEGVSLGWSQAQMANVGLKLIELAVEATGLFELKLNQTKVGKQIRRKLELHVTEAAVEWLDRQHERCELLDPVPLPMVVSPRAWTNPVDGGYLHPPIGTRLVQSHSRAYLEELHNIDMPLVYRAVNMVQGTRWRINRRVLGVLEKLSSEGGGLAGLPMRDAEPMPGKPIDFDENEDARDQWKRAASEVHAKNATGFSKRLAVAQQLWVARKLVDYPAIYFPHYLDFRGRVYPIPQGGPHPQAGDIGRSLLEFSEGKALGPDGARWLSIHVANLFGMDKVSFEQRIAWVDANRQAILDSAHHPLDGQRFWTTAGKPWAALAACFEWAGYLEEREQFVSYLPIAIDGSNSGLQHLTALLRDADAAPHVNLTATNEPGDIYMLIAAKAQVAIDASSDPRAAPWKDGRITRGIVKRPCMTYVYSAKPFGMADQIRAELARLDAAALENGQRPHLGGLDNFQAATFLATLLFRLIGETVPAAKRAMDWLKSAATVMNRVDLPIWWTTPAGLPVMQRYANTKVNTLDVTFRGKRIQLQLDDASGPSLSDWLERSDEPRMSHRAVLSGIAPNFVHSLDAAHLMLTTVAAQDAGILDLAVIHDSFGTHAADTDRLSVILRETFVAMYDADPLAQFRAQLIEQVGDDEELLRQVPALPAEGTFDLQSVLTADYMFA